MSSEQSPPSQNEVLSNVQIRRKATTALLMGAIIAARLLVPDFGSNHASGHKEHKAYRVQSVKRVELPRKLPSRVARKTAGAVKVYYGDYEGSGVKVGPDLVLTAGHMVVQHPKDKNVTDCSTSYVTNRNDTPGQSNQITSWFADYSRDKYLTTTDAALLRVKRDANFNDLPTVPVVRRQPKAGTKLYFINYEADLTGPGDRYPNTALAAQVLSKKQYGHPAEFAGVVLGHQGQALEVATSLRAYGLREGSQKNAHGGASGGGVIEANGELAGIEMGSWGVASVSEIRKSHSLQLLPHEAEIRLELVQPVTRTTLHHYEKSLGHEAVC